MMSNDNAVFVCIESNAPTRSVAAPARGKSANTDDDDDSSTGGADFGEATYTAVCEELHINRVQRVIDGLSTASLNLKYRCLGPLGAKALAAALIVSSNHSITVVRYFRLNFDK